MKETTLYDESGLRLIAREIHRERGWAELALATEDEVIARGVLVRSVPGGIEVGSDPFRGKRARIDFGQAQALFAALTNYLVDIASEPAEV